MRALGLPVRPLPAAARRDETEACNSECARAARIPVGVRGQQRAGSGFVCDILESAAGGVGNTLGALARPHAVGGAEHRAWSACHPA